MCCRVRVVDHAAWVTNSFDSLSNENGERGVAGSYAAAVSKIGDLWQDEKSFLTGCTHQKVSSYVDACLMSRRLGASCITWMHPILQCYKHCHPYGRI